MDARLFPDGFLETYRQVLGADPPHEFLEAYTVLAETVYFGSGLAYEDAGYGTGGKQGFERGYDFKEPRLLRLKWAIDRRLIAMAEELRRYAVAREGPRPSRGVPEDDRERGMGQPRGTRDPETDGAT